VALMLLLADEFSPLESALKRELEDETLAFVRPKPGEISWGDVQSVRHYILQNRPSLILNNLGWGSLSSRDKSTLLLSGTNNLAKVCAEIDIPLLHLSSHLVFGGENKTAYDESDRPSPFNDSGRAYLDAERAIEKWMQHFIVLRLSWVVGVEDDNLFGHLLSELSQGRNVEVSAARRGAPTFVADVARVVVAIVRQVLCGAENWGVMHYCSSEPCTEVELAQQLASLLQELGQPCGQISEHTDESQELVASAVLNGRLCRDSFGIQARSWRQGLAAVIQNYLSNQSA